MKSESFEKYVEHRLEEWAEWFNRKVNDGIGFPPHSVEYRLMTEAIIEKTHGPKPLECHTDAEEMESLVKVLSEHNPKTALALRIHYFGRRKSRDRSEELKVSATRFRIYVDMARQWLAGRLSAKYY